jgi:hypothetical protein
LKKIIFGVLGIVLAVTLVSGSAYALFSDTVPVSGLSLSTGSADLKINGNLDAISNALSVTNAYPGWIDGVAFSLTNSSTTPIQLDTAARLTAATGSWGELSPVVMVAVVEYASSTDANNAMSAKNPVLANVTANTGWLSLADWNSSTPTSFGTTLPNSGIHYYVLWSMIPSSADNSIAGKAVSVDYLITGTQL